MGIKKHQREINKAKNDFVKWLKTKGFVYIGQYEEISSGFEYYNSITAIRDKSYYRCTFIKYEGDNSVMYNFGGGIEGEVFGINEFNELLKSIK